MKVSPWVFQDTFPAVFLSSVLCWQGAKRPHLASNLVWSWERTHTYRQQNTVCSASITHLGTAYDWTHQMKLHWMTSKYRLMFANINPTYKFLHSSICRILFKVYFPPSTCSIGLEGMAATFSNKPMNFPHTCHMAMVRMNSLIGGEGSPVLVIFVSLNKLQAKKYFII